MVSPLHGLHIVNTRAMHQAADLDELIRQRGAIPLSYPCIQILPPEDTGILDAELQIMAANGYDWLILTSQNVVYTIAQRLQVLKLRINDVPYLKIATIGSSTAAAVTDLLGCKVDLLPEHFVAESLAESLNVTAGTRILLPQSEIARPVLAQSLIARGAQVSQVQSYRIGEGFGGDPIPHLTAQHKVDVITFTSTSIVHNFFKRFLAEGGLRTDLEHVGIACIGPVTKEALESMAINVSVMPTVFTLTGMLEGLEEFYSNLNKE